jgi:hypothetical protein
MEATTARAAPSSKELQLQHTIATALTVLPICSFEFFFFSFLFFMAKFSSFWEKRKGRSNRVVFIY